MYEILLESSAERDLKKLPAETFYRIITEIKDLGEEPRPVGSRKLIGSKSERRLRIGDYRVIYEVDEKIKIVKIMRVQHRREVYR